MASRGVASTGPLGLPKALATRTEELGDGMGTGGKSKLSYMFSEGPPDLEQALNSLFHRPGNLECFYLQAFARALPSGGGVGGETVMLMKLYFSSKESYGLSFNRSLPMFKLLFKCC